MSIETTRLPIRFSCYFTRSRSGEQFVPEHTIGYVVSGKLEVNDGTEAVSFREGDLYFCRRNRLGKYTKHPGESGEFRSISIFFEQGTLRNFSMNYGYTSGGMTAGKSFQHLPAPSVLSHYMESLKVYESLLKEQGKGELLLVKQHEALLLLLQLKPEVKDILFDFSVPGKIDLEAFMVRNYHFNVDLKRFAYLTGRSLSTFKRDFEKVFHLTPSRWLLQRRLQEAHYLIKEQKKAASDIYLDLGFEDLSHFSYAFKKQYGIAPSFV
ncbi:helix-turn-helix domain-containing protein [Filimonas effusa]|uniref:AraC family transcriptional regulator n=1 Tax=Filimonas effusa TaxID=2508721 RepID=A0A4Q1D6P8_9BACT|nr:AraC family transcriptional regulator [Filimonas effusa]RXK83676.1 AraC family transcriptional regulator [Filimonas effusa]